MSKKDKKKKKSNKDIYLASDHGGFELKEKLKKELNKKGFIVEDKGPKKFNKKDDYPDYIKKVGKAVSLNKNSVGIVLGYSGQGEAIVANKFPGVRACVYCGSLNLSKSIRLMRQHNNSNVLSIGAGFVNEQKARKAVELFLETKFENEKRHKRRINKINQIENKNFKK
ncbi:MAG: RpiB/LacA/LacB family sugar-phosphate isomerase [Nanoarchaeota archaeon]